MYVMLLIAQALFTANRFLNVLLLMRASLTKSFKNFCKKDVFSAGVCVGELVGQSQTNRFVSILPRISVLLRKSTNTNIFFAYVNRHWYKPSHVGTISSKAEMW